MATLVSPDSSYTAQLLTCSARQAGQYQAASGGAVSGGSKQCMWNPRSQPSHNSMSRARACTHGIGLVLLWVLGSWDTSARTSRKACNAHSPVRSAQQQRGNVGISVAGHTLEAQISQAVSS